jgi:hypothetical protein
MRKIFSILSTILLTSCLIAACQAASSSTPDTHPPTVDSNTLTPDPSRTPLPPPTRRPSQTPYLTESSPGDQTSFQTCDGVDANYLSPNRNWYICGGGPFFTVISRDGARWEFNPKDQFGFDYQGIIKTLYWSSDGNFLYFSMMEDFLKQTAPATSNANALLRMDLSNGKVAIVFGKIDISSQAAYFVSISPTGRRVAYVTYRTYTGNVPESLRLYMLDLKSGAEKSYALEPDYYELGYIVWSSNGNQLAYKLYSSNGSLRDSNEVCDYFYSIKFLDLTNDKSITFVKNAEINTCTESVSFDVLNVSDTQITLEKEDELWMYDVEEQRLTLQGSITPSP